MQVGEWSDAAFDHRERLENDGAASRAAVQCRCWPLLRSRRPSRPFPGNGCRPPVPAGRHHSCWSRTGTLSSGRGARTAAGRSVRRGRRHPFTQPCGRVVVGLPDPDLGVLALQGVPQLIEFDHHRLARRLGAEPIDIAANPAQHRWRCGAEQVGHGVERQVVAVQTGRRRVWPIRRTVPLKASELVSAPSAAPSLLTRDDAVPDYFVSK